MPTAVTFLGFVPLCFALILEAHGTLVHLVHLNAKLASKALGIICQRPRGEEKTKFKTEKLILLMHQVRLVYSTYDVVFCVKWKCAY